MMDFDWQAQLAEHNDGSTVATYTFSGDGLKRSEILATGRTTLIWDGTTLIGEI